MPLLAVMAIGVSESSGAQPYSASELRSVQSSDEAKIQDLRDQEVTQLRIALGRRVGANRRADLYLRLAEIYLESYRAGFLLEGRAHEKRLERNQSDPVIHRGYSLPYLSKGIAACQEILKLKIPFDKLDQVYYFLGFNYGELGNRKESLKYFTLLTQKYPSSPFVSEAYRELGDAAYASSQFRKSLSLYESALRRDRNLGQTAPRILHKLAWSYYRTKQYDRAIQTMKDAISAANQSGEKFLSLREEALRDMAVFMTETGRVEEAVTYFQSVAGDKQFYPKALERLGKQYERNVQPDKAAQVYESLLKTSPDDDAAFRVRVKLVDLDLRRGRYPSALNRLDGVNLFPRGDAETQTAAQNLRAMIRRTATERHSEYRKSGSKPVLGVAELFYSAYLSRFLSKEDPRNETPEIQMYLAEVKRELGKSDEASALYRRVLDSGDKRYAKEAGVLWTASLAEAIKRASPKGGSKSGEPSPLELEFVNAADEMRKALGDSNESREASLKAAQVLAGYKETQKDAIKRSKRIIETWPRSQQALTAARLWVQILADRLPVGSPAELERSDAAGDLKDVMKELRANSELMSADSELGQGKLKGLLAEQDSRFKVGSIARQEKEQNFAQAAKGYESFAADATQKDLAEKAYGNAVSSYLKIADYESVTRVGESWLKRYPKSPGAIESLRVAATAALIQGQFDASARLFEKLGKLNADAAALETAFRLHQANGNAAQAEALRRTYIQTYRKSSSVPGLQLEIARELEQAGQESEAAKAYRGCMASAETEAECGARLADLYFRLKDLDQAKALYRKVAALKSTARSAFVGYSRYRLGELLQEQTRFETLALPEAQLKKALGQRLDFLEPLSKAYLSAVEAGGPWGVAALNRLAAWALQFADDVDRITPPSGASPEAIAGFRKNLASVSQPLRKKALETWTQAYQKASQAEILSPVISEILDQLADARAPGVSRAQGVRGKFRLAGLPADGGSEGREEALKRTRERLTRNAQDAASWVDYGNLLWGLGKPLLAKIAYDRALSLQAKNVGAMNNRAVILLAQEGEEDWLKSAQALSLFRDALKTDDFFLPAKFNLAMLLNYYRLFAKARPLWEQVKVKATDGDILDGLAIATQGLGDSKAAEELFKKAKDAGAPSSRFSRYYHEAARAGDADRCISRLKDAEDESPAGFEKLAIDHLMRTCTLWKEAK